MMKVVLRSTSLWLLFALLLTACQPMQRLPAAVTAELVSQVADAASQGVANAAASREAPFKGTFEAVEQFVVEDTTLHVDASGSGNATQLGAFTVSYTATVNILDGSGVVSMQLVAANGDTIFAAGTGQDEPTDDPDVRRIVEQHIITGGTGRFAGAEGSFTRERVLNLVTGVTSGGFEGVLVRDN